MPANSGASFSVTAAELFTIRPLTGSTKNSSSSAPSENGSPVPKA